MLLSVVQSSRVSNQQNNQILFVHTQIRQQNNRYSSFNIAEIASRLTMVDSEDDPLLRLVPQGHRESVHKISSDYNILMYDGKPIGRVELVKSILGHCKQARSQNEAKQRCASCDILCSQRYKFWSRNMFKVNRSKSTDVLMMEVNEKMTIWMKYNDQNINNTNAYDGFISISVRDSDIISFHLPNSKQKKFSCMKFKVCVDKSIQLITGASEYKINTLSSLLDKNDSDDKSQTSCLSSSSVLNMPKMGTSNDLNFSLSISHTMGTSAESQASVQGKGISKRLLKMMEEKDLDLLQKYWEHCKKSNEGDVLLRKKFEFKSFLIDVFKVNHPNYVAETNTPSLFRKTVVHY